MKFQRLFLILFLTGFSYFGNAAVQDHVKIAAVQFPEIIHQTEADLLKMMTDFIHKAKDQHVNIILFPELHTTNLLLDKHQLLINNN